MHQITELLVENQPDQVILNELNFPTDKTRPIFMSEIIIKFEFQVHFRGWR